jgi:DIM1 family U5 snRNP protein
MAHDETLLGVSEKIKNFAVIYTCDISKVPDFTKVWLSLSSFLAED